MTLPGGDMEAFYEPRGGGYVASEHTRGPWDPRSQHAGPPCALLGRELDRVGALEPAQLARVSYEILRPIPIGAVEVSARVARPGRSVELVEGVLSHDGVEVILGRGWRLRTADVALSGEPGATTPLDPPEAGTAKPFFPTGQAVGYHSAMEVRFLAGGFVDPGPATAWMRMRVALVAGERPSPLDRVLVASDTGNGISAPLDYRTHLFINTDLTVNLRRLPDGEWIALDAVSHAGAHGVGLSDTVLHDRNGPLGRATQTLLIAERPEP